MKRHHIASLDETVSLLGFGCMRLPCLGEDKAKIDYETAQKMIDSAYQAGVNYFDTAWPYHMGQSETFIGEALKRYPRESFFLASKMPTWDEIKTEQDVERIFAQQLKKCQVEYFDFYLMHNLTVENYARAEKIGVYDLLRQKQKEGKIRHLGFSFHDHPGLLEQILKEHTWDFAQIQLNYLDWEDLDAKGQYELICAANVPVIVMEPVRGGALATLNEAAAGILKAAKPEASIASWAIRFAASLPNILTVLSGMSIPEQVSDNLSTFDPFVPLSEEEQQLVMKAAGVYRAAGTIPCTGCRYCMDCPAGVDIPRVFSIYNQYCACQDKEAFGDWYRSLRPTEQADCCVSCGQCMQHCPQGIDIPGEMKKIADFVASL